MHLVLHLSIISFQLIFNELITIIKYAGTLCNKILMHFEHRTSNFHFKSSKYTLNVNIYLRSTERRYLARSRYSTRWESGPAWRFVRDWALSEPTPPSSFQAPPPERYRTPSRIRPSSFALPSSEMRKKIFPILHIGIYFLMRSQMKWRQTLRIWEKRTCINQRFEKIGNFFYSSVSHSIHYNNLTFELSCLQVEYIFYTNDCHFLFKYS